MPVSLNDAKKYGFVFPGAREWISRRRMPALAKDASMAAYAGVPGLMTAYIDPMVIDILTTPHRAREIYNETKKGDWTTSTAIFRVDELTGKTSPYSDFAHDGMSGVNFAWPTREQYLFQTAIEVGDREADISAEARIQLAASKQRSAAHVLDSDSNSFYNLGVEGLEIYGALNDPNLSAPITPKPGASGTISWDDKKSLEIYEDVLDLFAELVNQSDGWVDENNPLKLVVSPKMAVRLGTASEYNISVLEMLNKYFSNFTLVKVPELSKLETGEIMQLIATEVRGQPTAELAFSEKMRSFSPVRKESSFTQKFCAGTYGTVIYLPFAIAQMRGI